MSGLQVGFWRDEVYTVVHYASRGPSGIWLGHYEPNDHVLFNLLAWVTHSLLGGAEAVYRLPSVIPGILAIVLLAAWLWRRGQTLLAVVFTALAVASPLQLELVKQARGYGLGFLAGALLLISAAELAQPPEYGEARERGSDAGHRRLLLGLGVAGLVGTWTLTVFPIAFLGELAALLVLTRRRVPLILVTALVGMASLAFYAPLLGHILSTLQHPRHYFATQGPRLSWYAFLLGPPDQFAAPFTRDLLHIHGLALPRILGLALEAAGAGWLWRFGRRAALAVLLTPLVVTELVLTLLRVPVNPRFVSFLLFHYLVLTAIGILALLHPLVRRVGQRVLPTAGALLAAALACWGTIALTRHWNAIPVENAKQVAIVVRRAGFETILTDSRKPAALRYYLGRRNISFLPLGHAQHTLCHAPAPLVFVDELAYRSAFVDTGCLADRGARLVVVPQRGIPERYDGAPLDVWLLGRPTPLRLDLPASTTTAAEVCGKHGPFPQLRPGALLVTGSLRVPHPTTWRVKVKLKRCTAGRFSDLADTHLGPGPDGRFRLTLAALPPGDYELRAEAHSSGGTGVAQSPRRLFRLGR